MDCWPIGASAHRSTTRVMATTLAVDIGRPAAPRASRTSRLVGLVRELGPYAAIALILPGGSLIALALLSRSHRAGLTPSLRGLVLVALLGASIMLPGST